MGLIVKKDEFQDEHDLIEGVEVIERSDVPDDLPENEVEVIERDVQEDAEGEPASDGADAEGEADAKGDDGPGERDDEQLDAEDAAVERPEGNGILSKKPYAIAIILIAVVVAGICGYFLGSGGLSASKQGAASAVITEEQLDTVVASYTYGGATHEITAREGIEVVGSLESARNDDGTYNMPGAETLIAAVRTDVLLEEAKARGIEVSDEDAAEFAERSYGTSDYAELAEQSNLDEDRVRELVHNDAMLDKLITQVAPAAATPEPQQPTYPADGDEDVRTTEYAQYIIELAGDAWDADAGTWASTDNAYYQALAGTDFTGETASYSQATAAYYVAYQEYSQYATQAAQEWRDYANDVLANVDVQLYGACM